MTDQIILLSGGMDSGVCLANSIAEGHNPLGLIISYKQSHPTEITKARELAKHYNIETIELDLSEIFDGMNSYLTGKAEANTYVPARNLVFSSVAVAIAEDLGIGEIVIGAHKEDAGGYPDTTEPFIEKLNIATQEGTKNNVKVIAPFVHKTKDKIVERGMELDFPFEKTITCYNNSEPACGECNSCKLRAKAFEEAGFIDPVTLKNKGE